MAVLERKVRPRCGSCAGVTLLVLKSMAATIVEARNLVKRYDTFEAVKGIDLTVETGECFGLLGPNGAGKSSTFRMLCCISPITGGTLTIGGMDVATQPRAIKAMLGVVPQENNLDTDLGVLQNLLVYGRYFDMPKRLTEERAWEVLRLFQLDDRANSKVDTLSGGMKRRLLIARALLNHPKVLVLDEPTTGLDPQARHLIWQKLRALQSEGVTVLLSTHYMEEAAQLCDRLAVMHEGMVLAEGRPLDLISSNVGEQVLEVGLGETEASQVVGWLDSAGQAVEVVEDRIYIYGSGLDAFKTRVIEEKLSLTQRPTTLEDVFLRLTGRALRE